MILIGLPIYRRDWILPTWLAAIEKQTVPLSELGFIFEFGPDDEKTQNILWDWHANHPEISVFNGGAHFDEGHKHHEEGKRRWKHNDYMRMVNYRNCLLDQAIALQPDAYFSLDSDIILENPKTIEILFDLVQTVPAVNTLSYMWPKGTLFPSVMSWNSTPGGAALRKPEKYNMGSLFKADIIMASVMMSPDVYNTVKYRWHRLGEDLGWSYNAYLAGFDLWCASYVYTPHILHKFMLDAYLKNGDDRASLH